MGITKISSILEDWLYKCYWRLLRETGFSKNSKYCSTQVKSIVTEMIIQIRIRKKIAGLKLFHNKCWLMPSLKYISYTLSVEIKQHGSRMHFLKIIVILYFIVLYLYNKNSVKILPFDGVIFTWFFERQPWIIVAYLNTMIDFTYSSLNNWNQNFCC